MKKRLSLNVRLPAIMSILLIALFVAIGISVWASMAAKNDTKIVNVAGRQRMLTQKFTKEVLDELNDRQVLASAKQIAAVASQQIVADRVHYTAHVIGKLKREWPDFKADANYEAIEGAIPLPATFVREVSENFDESAGYRYDLLSKWNINPDKGLHEGFEQEAWDTLSADPETPYHDIELIDGSLVLQYATADLAAANACVSCHNAHPGSPKKDFKRNDLMGILVVRVPVTQDTQWATTLLRQHEKSLEHPSDKTRKLFEVSIAALINGGTTFADLKMERPISLPPTKDQKIKEQLTEAQRLWKGLTDCVDSMKDMEVGSVEYLDQLRVLRTKNMATLKSMNTAVGLFQNTSERRTDLATNIQYGMVVVAILVFLFVTWYIRRYITNPLNMALASLASGAQQVTAASGQVAQSSQSMAEGSSEQAASMEEMSASLEELTAMTRQNTDNSSEAKTLSTEAQTDAEVGNEAMQRMSQAIDDIKKSSDETAGVVKTIEEIALQTNLLALNAAVEAARAGEAGKGFAVVAEEVRNLAQRAAKAARNTSELISESIRNAEHGVTISKEVAQSLGKIAEGAMKVNQIMGEVAAASGEQAQGIEQINTAVARVDQVAQTNAAISEESAAGAEELSAQAAEMMGIVRNLSDLVGGNNIEESGHLSAPPSSVPGEEEHLLPPQRRQPKAALLHDDAGRVVKSNDVIPLDDDDLAGF